MKKIDFSKDVLPHVLALVVFLIVTVLFFNPIFFDNKSLSQHDIQQFQGSSKSITDFRSATGEEALWAPSMFSGMPAYLVSVRWSDGVVSAFKKVMSVFLPHPIANIFLTFLCYYIMLLAFRVRPYLAIAGALAFGLSTYMIIGLGAGHNARIGAIAFLPLLMAGIHLAFSGKRLIGFATTTLGFALHLRENHLQMTYYFALIVLVYAAVQFLAAYREKGTKEFFKNVVILMPAGLIGFGTFFGPFWAITEYTPFTIRGPSEIIKPNVSKDANGLSKGRAFEYNNGIGESLTLLIPDIYGRNGSYFFVEDKNSESYKALANSGDNQMANQLMNYTYAYIGDGGAAYYAGAIIVFLFVVSIFLVDKKWLWWALPLCVLSVFLSWGANFSSFNYFMFDYFPGYNKFRSVTFSLIIILFFMPLLGMLGLEKFFELGWTKETKKKLLLAFGVTGGLCLLVILFAGMGEYSRPGDSQLPAWFSKALQADRKGMARADAFRAIGFILPIFIVLYFNLVKRISENGFFALLAFFVTIDLMVVDKRFLSKENFKRKHEAAYVESAADAQILKDKSYYRVYNLRGAWNEAGTSYYHYSLGGYHGAKLRRTQDLYDSCLTRETQQMITNFQKGNVGFENYQALNMLNAKYMVYGPEANNVIPNPSANGNAWFVKEVAQVSSANDELKKIDEVNTKQVAIIDNSKFKIPDFRFDSTSSIDITEFNPKYLKYESKSSSDGLVVFSEIYYPKGWHAFIDGKETEIFRADYVLRALAIPAGNHAIEFRFEPKPYLIGNKITMASSWLVLVIVLGCFGWSLKKEKV